ncbi:Npr2 [Acrasis kona]|uniref:Npr2 n=1 Tax=Acrasis kona TaxID=1008807 RepID=A0AAW2Z7T5_9EUKA
MTFKCGIHSGSFMAGVVGTSKFLFDVFGDTVNTASRICSSCIKNYIQLSNNTNDALLGKFHTKERGEIHLKGKGVMRTFWLIEEVSAGSTTVHQYESTEPVFVKMIDDEER